MPLANLVDELVSEIVTFVEPDLQSLKNSTLVNQRLGSIASDRLFARYTVHIRSAARMGMVGYRLIHGHISADFVALLHTSPRLVDLVVRVRLDKRDLVHHDAGFPSALQSLLNIRFLQFSYSPCKEETWTSVPPDMEDILLNSVFPRLTTLDIRTTMLNVPCDFLDHVPRLSNLNILDNMVLPSQLVISQSAGITRPHRSVRNLTFGSSFCSKVTKAQPGMIEIIERVVDGDLHLTLPSVHAPATDLISVGLGPFVKHLTVVATSDVPLPFKYFPLLEIMDIVIQARNFHSGGPYTTDLSPIIWLNQSLLGQKDVHLSKIVLMFVSFPGSFGPNVLAMATFAECDKLLEESCPRIRSLHATFRVNRYLTDVSAFSSTSAQQELGELLPRCREKGYISVENVTPDIIK
ncbi:hypothetical protein DL96DRAFT_1810698 [Flagelloscypha sp. PMI_526]|nr:hypothetical protein DL96DRAFT_1810698 [Flagelloscypha sp. PMI_526]